MFTIKSNVTESCDIKTSFNSARDFFVDGNNYVQLMPNIDSIHTDTKGALRWNISVSVPLVGNWRASFAVDFLETDGLIEWYPSSLERQNFLRCVAQLTENSNGTVQVKITNNLELRREKASDFHILANMAGEKTISQELQSEASKMIKDFLQKSKEKLED